MANSLSHSKWMCKYHIIFIPKYRRKDLGKIIKELCKYKGVKIEEGHLNKDHVHLLLSIPPKISVSTFMGYLKEKSSLILFERNANLKYKFGSRNFWAKGYYVVQ